jgi:hypothetical protein
MDVSGYLLLLSIAMVRLIFSFNLLLQVQVLVLLGILQVVGILLQEE